MQYHNKLFTQFLFSNKSILGLSILILHWGIASLAWWRETGLTELRLLHIWVWIHSTWLSVLWYRHHYWLWGRHIVRITLSKVLRIVVMRIVLRIRVLVYNSLCMCYSFLMIILITNILRLTILSSTNDSADAATDAT